MRCPTRGGSDEAAGWDLYSIQEKEILSGGYSLITSGISIAVLQGTYARIAPRSGLAVKNMIATGAEVINADYRGEVKVLLFNHGKQPFLIKDDDRWTEASLVGPGRLHFDPDTNPVNPTTTPMFATNPDERC
jgi:dUTP pyrophosphatase